MGVADVSEQGNQVLPVVAGQSGNTGTQALAVTSRALALREIRVAHFGRVVRKEIAAAVANGIAVALATALGVSVWSGSAGLCAVIGISMVVSMVLAATAGGDTDPADRARARSRDGIVDRADDRHRHHGFFQLPRAGHCAQGVAGVAAVCA